MKKLFLVVSLLMVLVMAPMVMADQLTVNRVGLGGALYWTGSGGEFTLSGDDIIPFQNLYSNSTKNQGITPSIESFCIERDEFVGIPGTYYFKLNSAAVMGGTGGPEPDPISKGTAWLYHQFQSGILDGYEYTPGPARATSAGLLQNAFWWLEEEGFTYNSGNIFMKAAFDNFGGEVGAMADNDVYPVGVLNLYSYNTQRELVLNQDLLVCVPEPASMLLLGSGLIGLAGYARKRFRK